MSNISSFKPLRDSVFVEHLDGGAHVTKGGIITLDDNMTLGGARPRWGQVFAIGPDITEIAVGDWLLIPHGRWTNSMTLEENDQKRKIWRVEWSAVMLVADEDPREMQFK